MKKTLITPKQFVVVALHRVKVNYTQVDGYLVRTDRHTWLGVHSLGEAPRKLKGLVRELSSL